MARVRFIAQMKVAAEAIDPKCVVTDPDPARSSGVTSTMSVALQASPATAALNFDALYRAARDDVFAYVATLLRDAAAAEDVTALAFERAFRKRRRYDARRGSERAWLFGIARNAALDELRRRKRGAALAGDLPDDRAPAPEDEADRAVRRAAVAAALRGLPPREREVIALKFHAGLDNAELAGVLGVSVSNAGTLLHRAMTKLREAVDDHA
jgi:RNA polymerase sigma factor (sigma-70 family)